MLVLLWEIMETAVWGGLLDRVSLMMEVQEPLMKSETEVVDSEGLKVRVRKCPRMMIVIQETLMMKTPTTISLRDP